MCPWHEGGRSRMVEADASCAFLPVLVSLQHQHQPDCWLPGTDLISTQSGQEFISLSEFADQTAFQELSLDWLGFAIAWTQTKGPGVNLYSGQVSWGQVSWVKLSYCSNPRSNSQTTRASRHWNLCSCFYHILRFPCNPSPCHNHLHQRNMGSTNCSILYFLLPAKSSLKWNRKHNATV